MSTTTKESINLLRLGDDYPHDCLFAELSAVSPDGFLEDKDSNEFPVYILNAPLLLISSRISDSLQTGCRRNVW